MHRKELQKLAQMRLKEANMLFAGKAYSGAYYLAGYVIECAFKAVIAKNIRGNRLPDKKIVENIYKKGHDFISLIGLANLQKDHEARIRKSPQFQIYWSLIGSWRTDSRYQLKTRQEAESIILAVQDSQEGVLTWIKKHW